ncbi:hypothetical protein HY639_04780 [Candidatus Woesearchaeota archaeon]|nr:hypothetical protein [Candidatus Woesearchaeota archaeon]
MSLKKYKHVLATGLLVPSVLFLANDYRVYSFSAWVDIILIVLALGLAWFHTGDAEGKHASWYGALIMLLVMVATVHTWRLLYGGLLC